MDFAHVKNAIDQQFKREDRDGDALSVMGWPEYITICTRGSMVIYREDVPDLIQWLHEYMEHQK